MTNENEDNSLIMKILKQIPLFSELDENLHREIIKHIVLMYYPANYTIFSEGDDGDALHIIKKGRVEIFHPAKDEDGEDEKVSEIGGGGFFGEMALVSDLPRNASAKTLDESEIFILSKTDFSNLLNSNSSLAEQVSATVISRLNENSK